MQRSTLGTCLQQADIQNTFASCGLCISGICSFNDVIMPYITVMIDARIHSAVSSLKRVSVILR